MTTLYEKSNSEEILNLHSMGFKLVPIAEDRVTPTIEWTKVYENGWNEVELNNIKFPNIATCFGKTHIRDKDGRELYLNCFDVDSEEVYTRFALTVDQYGKEHFFINELREHTYVTKTRKTYGLHIYWLSHSPNAAIHNQNCKPGFEFEIKTDKSGLASLPNSKHRYDENFHYHNIGQNRIMINDSLYERIVHILDDCIRRKYAIPKCDYETVRNRQLSDAEIAKISELITPLYRTGSRNQICYSISGLLYRNGVGLDTASKIINIIAREDEEWKSRLAVMRYTYSKKRNEVSGRRLLLETLEFLCNDRKQATALLREILKILNPGAFESQRQFDHNIVAEELIGEYNFRTVNDTEEVYYYDSKTGKYLEHGEILIKQQLELLFPSINTRHVNEVLQKIKRKNPVERSGFDSTHLVNVQNGLLNPLTAELIAHSPNYLVLSQLPITFDPNAKCPKILRFLSQVLRPRDIFTFMQFVGYCLLKNSKYEKSLFLLGKGDNGKSVLLKLVESFLGLENVSHVSLKELSEDKFSKAELFGNMANTCGDLESYKVLDSSAFKQLVSGDSVRAQRKGQHPFYFRNHAKLIFSSNSFPSVTDSEYSWYKRIILLVFLVSFVENRDVNKIDELTTPEELSGFLNLVLIALKQLIKTGEFAHIEDPRLVQQYFDERLNSVKNFLTNMCTRSASSFENSSDVYEVYCKYCKQNETVPVTHSSFGICLSDLGILKSRRMVAGTRYYVYTGIKFKDKIA